MRQLTSFACEGCQLVGTLDDAPGTTGVLIVSGGNEIRIGAHRGMAWLAAEIAAAGHPVFRYDRRGIGDSEGANGGFESGRPDLIAATATFRTAQPQLTRVIGFGNCDAASTLALWGHDAGLDGLLLANPWVIEAESGEPPAEAIRARYADRLRRPSEWKRLLTGGVNLGKLARGLARVVRPAPPTGLAPRIAAALDAWPSGVAILLAERDNTALAFDNAFKTRCFAGVRERAAQHRIASSSHSFASAEDKLWLRERVLAALG